MYFQEKISEQTFGTSAWKGAASSSRVVATVVGSLWAVRKKARYAGYYAVRRQRVHGFMTPERNIYPCDTPLDSFAD